MGALSFERYALAGNATFTLVSRRTGKHLTFNVRRADSSDACWWVNGPNREFLGRIVKDLRFFPSKNLPVYAEAFAWAWRRRSTHNPNSHENIHNMQFDFLPSGKCCRCGRKLTTPESIAAGIGPECAEALENS